MTNKYFSAKTWAELYELPRFLFEAQLKEQMLKGRIAGDYHMPNSEGRRPCAIASCATPHLNGWIIELNNLDISHVGFNCGVKYFHDWTSMKNTYRSYKKERSRILAVEELRKKLLNEIQALKLLSTLDYGLYRDRLNAFDALPSEVCSAIASRASNNDGKIYGDRIQTMQEASSEAFRQNKKKAVPRNIQYVKADIKGLYSVGKITRLDFLLDVSISRVLQDAQTLVSKDLIDTELLNKMLHNVNQFKLQIDKTLAESNVFFNSQNVAQFLELHIVKQLGIKSLQYQDSLLPKFTFADN